MKRTFRVVLAGNPNCGKTTIFNQLTGTRQHVGNYPGVTVESKSGHVSLDGMEIELIDLPGIYSLSSSSPEEEVAFQVLTSQGIDLIVNVIDSSVPQRNLYLTTQLAELRIPMLLVFNVADEAEKKGLQFDLPKLERYFGAEIVQTVGSRGSGVTRLREALRKTLSSPERRAPASLEYGPDVDDAIRKTAQEIEKSRGADEGRVPARFLAIKLLEHDSSVWRDPELDGVHAEVEKQIRHLYEKHAIQADTFMADCRYAMLAGACREAISVTRERRQEISDRIDSVVTNRLIGLPLFFLIMYAVFVFTFTCADPMIGWIERGFGALGDAVGGAWPETTLPFLRSLLISGVIDGVGGVIVFLPNILFLFLAIAFLEDSGYMARAAFVMDGVMRKFGLHGKSFVPLVLGFGCTVPAIMATRSIESEKDRVTTILVLPLISCSARLPIYALLIPAFFAKKDQPLVMWLIYAIGIVMALIAARAMKSTLFKGDGEVYLMELPPYRLPTLKSVLLHMWDRCVMYLHKAGTIILATSVILFIANTYPEKTDFRTDYDVEIAKAESARRLTDSQIALLARSGVLDSEARASLRKNPVLSETLFETLEQAELSPDQRAIVERSAKASEKADSLRFAREAERMEYTLSGRIGRFLEPVFKPLGFDWRVTTAAIGALAAKEVFVSQMGILYSVGAADEESAPLRQHLRENYTPLQAFCMMLFCLLSIPCLATLAIIRRELNSWKMVFAEAFGLFLLAYLVTLAVYQIGTLLQIGTRFLV